MGPGCWPLSSGRSPHQCVQSCDLRRYVLNNEMASLSMRATQATPPNQPLMINLAYKREVPLCLMMADSARNRSASAGVFAEDASLSSFADIAVS
jgi:hypothetical protein